MSNQSLIALLIFHFVFIKFSSAQQVTDTSFHLSEELLNWDYKIYNSKEKIDRHLIRFLKNEWDIDLKLAKPGEEFNKSDLIVEGFPNKRLIINGKSSNQTGFILYEQGGNVLYNICLIYRKTKKNHYDIEVLRLNSEIRSFEKLQDAIRFKKFVSLN